MGKIFYILGKSCSGKDTIYKRICEHYSECLKPIIPYTTRPKRSKEENGREYFFTDEADYEKLSTAGKVIESRIYNTVHGPWRYYTVLDDQFETEKDLITIGVLEAYNSIKNYFGEERVIPIFVDLDDGVRLQRALNRELKQENPKYSELCRRYLSDSEDFSDKKIKAAGIEKRFYNDDLELCIKQITEYIDGYKG